MKHTPGPWFAANGNQIHDRETKFDLSGASIGNTANLLATIKYPYKSEQGQAANARLIAAAPLMLGALKDTIAPLNDLICAAIKHEKWVAEGLATDCLERVEEAIAAAEGRIKVAEIGNRS